MSKELTKELFSLLKSIGLPFVLVLVIVIILFVAITKPENFKIYAGFLWNILAGPFTFLRKKAIRFQIEGPLTKSLKKIAKELPDLEIPSLNIKWVKTENLETTLKDGKAIIKLKYDNDQTTNIIKATTIYVKDAFLVNSKPYLSENFTKAIDLTVTKKILLQADLNNKGNIIPQFIDENKNEDEEVFEKFEKIEEIDDNGLFTRVILRELNHFGETLFGRVPRLEYKTESEEFLNFVYTLVTREYDDNTPLVFNQNILKIGFLLVAKAETYETHGLEAYYRRIRLNLANGVKSFYLLARSEKVEILEKVAQELLQTGNFILRNQPKEYIDNNNRKCICYSLEVNQDSILASTLSDIGKAIKENTIVNGVVKSVRENRLLIDVNGISGEVKFHNISSGKIEDARNYFKEGNDIELKPLEILEGGNVNYTLINTKSDPFNFVKSEYEIGSEVRGKVIYVEDGFIKLDIGNDVIEGIAFRKDLTYSKYLFLHNKFEVDKTYDFQIKDYDFSKGRVILKLSNLKNPWESSYFFKNQKLSFKLMRKGKSAFLGEVEEGIEALIPLYHLGWTDKEQKQVFDDTRLGAKFECTVQKVEEEILILSARTKNKNPYEEFFEENKGKILQFEIREINEYGINGLINNLKIYIPKYEISWNGSSFKYFVGKRYKVYVKEIGKRGEKLIGSFKPIIPHPLENFEKKFKPGDVLKNLEIKEVFDWGIVYKINFQRKIYDGYLLIKNISRYGYIDNIHNLKHSLNRVPLEIAEINFEQNRIILSLKGLTSKNNDRLDQLEYTKEYNGFISGKVQNDFSIIIPNYWIEGKLEDSDNYKVGENITVRPSFIGDDKVVFTDN